MISECFKEILDNYETISSTQPYKGNEFASRIRKQFKNEVKNVVEECTDNIKLYRFKGYVGRLDWTKQKPQIRIGNNLASRTFEKGLYLFYEFEPDGSGLYLSLDQGYDYPKRDIRVEIANKLLNFINLDNIPEGFQTEYDENDSESKLHNDTIISKFYKYQDLDEDILKGDLKSIIPIFENIVPRYLDILEDMNLIPLIEDIRGDNYLDNEEDSDETLIVIEKELEDEEIDLIDLNVPNFYDFLTNKGYYFNKKVIENYLLSLKVKPFTILTGNSGTGKTKLSQLFAEYLTDSNYYLVNATTRGRSWGYSKDGSSDKRCGWTLSAEDFANVLPLYAIEGTYEIEIGGYRINADITFLPQIYYKRNYESFRRYFKRLYELEEEQKEKEKEVGISHTKQKVKLGVKCESISSAILDDCEKSEEISITMALSDSVLDKKARKGKKIILPVKFMDYVPLKTSVPCEITADGLFAKGNFDLKFRISNYKNEKIQEYLETLEENGAEEFELKIFGFKPNIEDFTPIWDAVEYVDKNGEDSGDNYAIVPVGANWTENRNVVGYYNVLTKEYQHTQSLDLLLKADGESKPFFLILDEMNLSHVERYFSDFLSAMESDKPIPLHKAKGKVVDVPSELKIPNNVFIVGTVNVDETTYMFSPKVLDRANVLEFKTFEKLSILDYIKSKHPPLEFTGDVNYLEDVLSDMDLRDNILDFVNDEFGKVMYENVTPIIVNEGTDEEYENHIHNKTNVVNEIANELSQINEYLKGSGFEFGYRTVNEILAFMFVAWKYEYQEPIWNNWRRYLDAQILQKILPKLHGSQMVLGETLDNLLVFCLGIESIDDVPELKNMNGVHPYPESAKKLIHMKEVLEKQRYVSFIN